MLVKGIQEEGGHILGKDLTQEEDLIRGEDHIQKEDLIQQEIGLTHMKELRNVKEKKIVTNQPVSCIMGHHESLLRLKEKSLKTKGNSSKLNMAEVLKWMINTAEAVQVLSLIHTQDLTLNDLPILINKV